MNIVKVLDSNKVDIEQGQMFQHEDGHIYMVFATGSKYMMGCLGNGCHWGPMVNNIENVFNGDRHEFTQVYSVTVDKDGK